MRIENGVKRTMNEASACQRTHWHIILYGLLALIGSAGLIGVNIDVSHASPMRVASADAGKDFVALSLKDSSAIAARFSQETLSIGYGVGSKAIEVAIPVPPVRPALKKPDVIKSLRAQAACMTGGMFDACPGFMKLLESRQQTWPRFADAALPDAGAPLTTGSLPDVKVASAAAGLNLTASDVVAAVDRLERRSGEVIMGAASTYNPYDADDNDAGGAETASGELYNPIGWTAAIQTGMRGEFAGVRYGRLYKPSFALVEVGGKRAIVKINDVGPLRPGRVIDLSTQVMHYFDPSLKRGVLDGALVTPLVGSDWTPGPLGSTPAVAIASSVL